MEQVYDLKEHCCGCSVCVWVCPRKAIHMEKDELGHRYPVIDQAVCVNCGLCASTCSMKNPLGQYQVMECYAAQSQNEQQLMRSTSGGVFSAIASEFLKSGGYVCGAAMIHTEKDHQVKHIMIDSLENLPVLQGSKYVQSNLEELFESIKEKLSQHEKVLFSGTPCQVSAVKSLFRDFESQLFCIDIICHGVPSEQLFNDYLLSQEQRSGKLIQEFVFRDKKYGWGLKGKSVSEQADGELSSEEITPSTSSYYRFFLDGETYRDSCYECPFASTSRVGDLTLGDYWGIDTFNPELLHENGGGLNKKHGISSILVNTDQGRSLLKLSCDSLNLEPILLESVVAENTQLRRPAKHSAYRGRIIAAYVAKGYQGVADVFERRMRSARIKSRLAKVIPSVLVKAVRNKLKG